MTATKEDSLAELTKSKARLGKLLFITSLPALAMFVALQVILHVAVDWQGEAPLASFSLPLFILFLALILANISFIYLLVVPQCKRRNIEFGYYSLNLASGPFGTSASALTYYIATGNIVLTIPLDTIAVTYTVWFAISYRQRFQKM